MKCHMKSYLHMIHHMKSYLHMIHHMKSYLHGNTKGLRGTAVGHFNQSFGVRGKMSDSLT